MSGQVCVYVCAHMCVPVRDFQYTYTSNVAARVGLRTFFDIIIINDSAPRDVHAHTKASREPAQRPERALESAPLYVNL